MSETIQRTKLYEDVTERMLDHIRTETWAPGTKIPPEVELAKLFDVSRCTIREAVKSLQIAGFLRSRAGSGTFVSERAPTLLQTQALAGIMADPAALRELVQARYILEPQLAQMAAQAATEEEIRGLFAIPGPHEARPDPVRAHVRRATSSICRWPSWRTTASCMDFMSPPRARCAACACSSR